MSGRWPGVLPGCARPMEPLAYLAVRLERAHLRKSTVIDRLEAHLLSRLEG